MAQNKYKSGDVVSVRTRLVRDDEPGFGFPGIMPQFTFRDIDPEYARWLSDADQDSLLRVVKASLNLGEIGHDRDCSAYNLSDGACICGYRAFRDALNAVPDEIIARLSEITT